MTATGGPMSLVWTTPAARWRGALLLVAAILAPSLAGAQRKPRDAQVEQQKREVLLQKIDSLRWEFEHHRLSAAERDAIRKAMTEAFRDLERTMVEVRALEAEDRAAQAVRVYSRTPGAMTVTVGPRVRPRGYLGLSFDGPNSEDVRNDELFVRFYQYPLIALVEPSSPADRAGIRKGDTLIALNGTDVLASEVPLSRMLVPEEKVTVRVRRGGDTHNFPVIVGQAPEYVVRRALVPMVAPAPRAPRAARVAEVPMVAVPEAPEAASAPQAASFVWVYNQGIGGAKLETVSEGLGRALGVEEGVLVLRALAGTPAYEAGLRDGDVIIRADGRAVSTVRQLQNAATRGPVKLVVVRDRKQREVTLRW